MGEAVFNKNYPDPQGHDQTTCTKQHFHIMFSFWPYLQPGSAVYEEMDKRGYFIARTQVAGISSRGPGALRRHSTRTARRILLAT